MEGGVDHQLTMAVYTTTVQYLYRAERERERREIFHKESQRNRVKEGRKEGRHARFQFLMLKGEREREAQKEISLSSFISLLLGTNLYCISKIRT